jgi:hypothetical protein
MRLILSLVFIALAQAFLSAETKAQTQTPSCPSVGILINERNPVLSCHTYDATLIANVTDVAPEDKPTFKWTVSVGKVISGQGTSMVKIGPSEGSGETLTVTVEVGGVSALTTQCNNRATAIIGFPEPCCPTVDIQCPTDLLKPGEPATFSVNISGAGPPLNPKYKWQVSAGRIISGQGTPEISVDRKGTEGQTITATVEIDGLEPACDRVKSCSMIIYHEFRAPKARKFDEYGDVSLINEETRLANFDIQLRQEPGAQGYVIVYGSRRVKPHIARVRKFLIEKRGLEPSRIVLMDGGYSKTQKVELWIVPTGAAPPTAKQDFRQK